MVSWNLLLFVASLSVSTSIAFPTKAETEMIVKIPDECKEQRLCATKPVDYEHLENEINSSLPDLRAKDHDDKAVGPGVQKVEYDVGKQNCPEEDTEDFLYNYMDNDFVESVDKKFKLINTYPGLSRSIPVVKCGQQQKPLSNDSNKQCFQKLLEGFGFKSSCETITVRQTKCFYNEDKTKLYIGVFRTPIACSCIVSYK